jgi:hypothetical protein
MKKTLLLLAATLGLTLGSLGTAGAVGHQGPIVPIDNQKFETSLVAVDRPTGGAFEGTLNLTISADGIVSGWFRDDGRSSLRTVTGGVEGDQIWLEIGSRQAFHIDGTYRNGVIVGYTHLDQNYEFEAKPTAN